MENKVMICSVIHINKNGKKQYYGLISANGTPLIISANRTPLRSPDNWKTKQGARKWAEKHGFTVV